MKRLFALLLALAFALGFSMTALAADETPICSLEGVYNSSGNAVTKIRRSSAVILRYSVTDPNVFVGRGESADSAILNAVSSTFDCSFVPTSSFSQTKGKSISKSVSASGSGFLQIGLEIPVSYTGKGDDVEFSISYATATDIMPKIYTVTSSVPYCEEYKEKTDTEKEDDEEELAPLTPYIIVSNYSYGGTSVNAGSEFTLSLTMRNTSSECDLENIKMNLIPRGFFSVASSSNTFYIDRLSAGGEISKSVLIKAGMSKNTDNDDTNSIEISFNYQYTVDKTRKDGASNEMITIPVIFPDRFELGMLEIGNDVVFAGDECSIYLPMVNKGRSSVYNLSASVECEDCAPVQVQYMGNLAAGADTGADFSLVFPEGGEYSGTIVVTYEDANGEERTAKAPFTVTVTDFEGMFDPNDIPPDDFPMDPDTMNVDAGPFTKRNLAIGGGAAVVVIGGIAYVLHKRRKAKEWMDDEEI